MLLFLSLMCGATFIVTSWNSAGAASALLLISAFGNRPKGAGWFELAVAMGMLAILGLVAGLVTVLGFA